MKNNGDWIKTSQEERKIILFSLEEGKESETLKKAHHNSRLKSAGVALV